MHGGGGRLFDFDLVILSFIGLCVMCDLVDNVIVSPVVNHAVPLVLSMVSQPVLLGDFGMPFLW